MYVKVHVNVCDHEKLMDLFRSVLVKDFHPDTSILFENNQLELKLFFKKDPPQEAIYAFCECGNVTYLEYNYNTNNSINNVATEQKSEESNIPPYVEYNFSEKDKSSEKAPSPAESNQAQGNSEKGENVQKRSKFSAAQKAKTIPEFEELAKTSNSKSEFLTNVVEFLEIPNELRESFLQIVAIYPELPKPTWDSIINCLNERNISFNNTNRRTICDCVTKKLNIRCTSAIATINLILYDHASKKIQTDEKAETHQAGSTSETETAKSATEEGTNNETAIESSENAANHEKEPLFKCMPKLVQSECTDHVLTIEKLLKSIDPQLDLDTKINMATAILAGKCMPTAISEKDLSDLYNFTIKTIKNFDLDRNVLRPEQYTPDKLEQTFLMKQRLTWTTIANCMAKFYNPETTERIQAVDFLSDLKEFLEQTN